MWGRIGGIGGIRVMLLCGTRRRPVEQDAGLQGKSMTGRSEDFRARRLLHIAHRNIQSLIRQMRLSGIERPIEKTLVPLCRYCLT
ncbi:hypothetical protein D3C78_705220 [compost metagenome]